MQNKSKQAWKIKRCKTVAAKNISTQFVEVCAIVQIPHVLRHFFFLFNFTMSVLSAGTLFFSFSPVSKWTSLLFSFSPLSKWTSLLNHGRSVFVEEKRNRRWPVTRIWLVLRSFFNYRLKKMISKFEMILIIKKKIFSGSVFQLNNTYVCLSKPIQAYIKIFNALFILISQWY